MQIRGHFLLQSTFYFLLFFLRKLDQYFLLRFFPIFAHCSISVSKIEAFRRVNFLRRHDWDNHVSNFFFFCKTCKKWVISKIFAWSPLSETNRRILCKICWHIIYTKFLKFYSCFMYCIVNIFWHICACGINVVKVDPE